MSSLKNEAYLYLKQKILSCEYRPGMRLNEKQLCEEMGNISRTPMRDAISRLEQERLIRILPKKGLVVEQVSNDDIEHIYEVRFLVEPYAIKNCGKIISLECLENCRETWKNVRSEKLDNVEFCALDDAFHALVVESLENPYLKEAYNAIIAQNSRLRLLSKTVSDYRVEQTIAEHLAVLDACIDGEYSKATTALKKHLINAKKAAFEVATFDFELCN